MGMFDFVKNAGENLLKRVGLDGDPDAGDIVAAVKKHDLDVAHLDVGVKDDMATVAGMAKDMETKEKTVLVVGNVKGIAKVDDRLGIAGLPEVTEAAPPPEPESRFHTVVSGDSLSKIARDVYGNAMKYPVIFEANKPMLSDPDKIYPGQVLRIPPLADA